MSGFAWVTLATNDSYSLGALVLAHSLKQAGTSHQLVVLVTPGVTNIMRQKLEAVFNLVLEVNTLDSKDEANLRLLKRPELGITFTKLHCWRLVQFEKCVFLDADTLVLSNCDELFQRDEFSAAPDVGWPDCFNSGVFVYKPSNETYNKLVDFALQKGSFDGGDQGLLNLYFSDWAHTDISKHLPFIYNMCSTATYSYLPAFKQYGKNAKIVHFIGPAKPWLQYFDTETCKVYPSSGLQHMEDILQKWWNLFCSSIHSSLTPDMAGSKQSAEHFLSYPARHSPISNFPYPITPNHSPSYAQNESEYCEQNYSEQIWDPWEEFDKQVSLKDESYDQCYIEGVNEPQPLEIDLAVSDDTPIYHNGDYGELVEDSEDINADNLSDNVIVNTSVNCDDLNNCVVDQVDKSEAEYSCSNSIYEVPTLPSDPDPIPRTMSIPNECEPTSTIYQEHASLHQPDIYDPDIRFDSGLAGAFAQFTLGAKRTPTQDALENHLRRQAWEVGNIDYLGRDSFDNIWSKICESLSTSGEQQASAPPTAVGGTTARAHKTASR